jgi:hypothetical protein
MLQRSAVTAV